MIHSIRFTCVLDTNVIYPVDIRDILLWFAYHDLFTPKWSSHIFDELAEVMKRKGIAEAEISKQLVRMNTAFPDANVNNYEELIGKLDLPDKKDCHVLAAAIKANANLIVTNNVKHFSEDYIGKFGLSLKTADDFITDTIDLNQKKAVEAFNDLVANRTNPSLDHFQVLDIFRNRGLKNSADYLHSLI